MISSGAVYSTISVHRFEHLMVPRFCWFDLRLQWSLFRMRGVPVSSCESSIANPSCCARTVSCPRPSASCFSYNARNLSPWRASSPLALVGARERRPRSQRRAPQRGR